MLCIIGLLGILGNEKVEEKIEMGEESFSFFFM